MLGCNTWTATLVRGSAFVPCHQEILDVLNRAGHTRLWFGKQLGDHELDMYCKQDMPEMKVR